MIQKINSIFENIADTWVRQLPLFVMLVIYSTAPAYFYGWLSYKTYLLILLPQVILPSLLLCYVADRRRWLWWIVFIAANLLWMIELGCLFCQHQRFWPRLAILVAQSNPDESSEFLSSVYVEILKTVFAVMVSAAVFYLWDHFRRRKSSNISEKGSGRLCHTIMRCMGVMLALSIVYSPISIYRIAMKDKDYDSRINGLMQFYTASSWIMYAYAWNDVFYPQHIKNLPRLADAIASAGVTLVNPADSLTIVYVIGESFNRNRSSLYGYPLETNPMMAKERADSSLIVFDNVISFGQFTSIVFRTLMSTYDRQKEAPFESYPLLAALMKKAGYKVSFIDNQCGIVEGAADWLSSYFFSDEKIRSYCLDTYNDKVETYDLDLTSQYPPDSGDRAKNFMIYHLMGQHYMYKSRYPEGFGKFTQEDYRQYEDLSDAGAVMMSEYDNATLYNDYVLHNIIEKLMDKTAVLVYTSDHGEEVFDYREFFFRTDDAPLTTVRLFYEVPVMIWMSDSFRLKYPDIVSALRDNAGKAIYNSDLPHTILDIAGIMTATFNPDVSLIRGGDGRAHRHVLMHDIDYDASHREIYRQKLRYEQ